MQDETPNQRQARLRRERREAKISAEGSSRLEKITNAAGRQNLAESFTSQQATPRPSLPANNSDSQTTEPASSSAAAHGSPEALQQAMDADFRALLESSAHEQPARQQSPQSQGDDPMLKMLAELMGGSQPGAPLGSRQAGSERPPAGIPPNLASLLGDLGAAEGTHSSEQQAQAARDDLTWKVIHVVFACALGIYVISTSSNLGRDLIRIKGQEVHYEGLHRDGTNLFLAFSTVELVLQSLRYFLERGKTGSNISGLVGTVSAFLPEPWAGYIRLAARYSGIWTTFVEDACVLIFMIGLFSWWRGAAT